MMVFYTRRFVPRGFAGCARGPFIFIRPEYRNDRGLLEHEKAHVRQFWRTLGFHGLLKLVSRRYRLACEVEAYRKQLEYSPQDLRHFARFLATKYGFRLSTDQAVRLLK